MGWSPKRMMENVQFDTNGGCWIWDGYISQNGYGQARQGQKMLQAHRLSYSLFKEEIGPCLDFKSGKVVMHTCDVRCCVNPDHLVLGTQRENIADRHKKGRSGTSINSIKRNTNWKHINV